MSSLDFFRKLQPLFEAADLQKAGAKAVKNIKADAAKKKKEEAEKKPANVKETAGEFFRRYSDIIVEAEDGPQMTEEAAAEKINQIIMQAVKQAAASKLPQVKESVVNEGILQKIMPIVAAAGIGLGAMGAATDASAQGQQWQSREQVTTQSGQTAERECTNRAQQVADLVNQYGHVLQSHTEIIKQCGPYIITGQRIEVRDNNVANILIGVLGVAAVIQQNQQQQQHQHGGYEQRNYGNQGTYSNGNYKGNQGPGGNRDAGGFYPYGGYRR